MKEQEQSHFFLLTIRCIGAQLLSGVPSPLPPASARLRPSSHPEAAQAFPQGFSSSLWMVNKGTTDPVISSSRWQHIGKVCSLEHLPVPQRSRALAITEFSQDMAIFALHLMWFLMSVKGTDIYFTCSLKCIREQHACSHGLAPYAPPASSSRYRVRQRNKTFTTPHSSWGGNPASETRVPLCPNVGVKIRQSKCSPATHKAGSSCAKAQPGTGEQTYIRPFIPIP